MSTRASAAPRRAAAARSDATTSSISRGKISSSVGSMCCHCATSRVSSSRQAAACNGNSISRRSSHASGADPAGAPSSGASSHSCQGPRCVSASCRPSPGACRSWVMVTAGSLLAAAELVRNLDDGWSQQDDEERGEYAAHHGEEHLERCFLALLFSALTATAANFL